MATMEEALKELSVNHELPFTLNIKAYSKFYKKIGLEMIKIF